MILGTAVNPKPLGAQEEIEAILRLRRARRISFGRGLFSDPAWEIMLQLFAARLGGRRVKLAELDIDDPQSTVARWAALLETHGLISCHLDCVDSNELWLDISSVGGTKMSALFRNLHHQGWAV